MAKPPTPQKIDYLYCENPKCTYHATHLVANKPKDLGPGSPCPLSAPDKLVMIELTTTAPIPPPTPTDPPTGIVLPAAPYGGFMLMLEDDDESSTWERAKQTDARHAGARYVAELRRDLVRLAFYAGTRFQAGEPAGKVTLPLVASVLDLKRHLTQFYGVPASDKLDEVKKGAASGTGKIYFRKLRNPAEVYNQFRSWQLALVGGGSTMEQKLAKFGQDWAKRKRAGKIDSTAQIEVARAEIIARRSDLAALRARRDQLKKDIDTIKTAVSAGKTKRAQLKASLAGQPADEVKELDEKLKEIEKRVGDADKKVKELDTEIGKQKTAIDELDKKLQAMGPKLLNVQKDISARDRTFTLMRVAIGQIRDEAAAAAADAAALAKAPPAPFGWPLPPSGVNLVGEKANAVKTIEGWRTEQSPPAKSGLLVRLPQQALELENGWTAPPAGIAPVSPPPGWSGFKVELDDMRKWVIEFHEQVKASDASTLFDNYRQELREFGTVDQATARYVRQMLTAGSLNNLPVFFNPMDDEIEKFDVSDIRKVIGDIIDELAMTVGKIPRTGANVPIDLLEFIFGHESGKNHTMKWGGREFVLLGIDWANSGDKSNFEERATSPKQLSSSRGWGITQFTQFEQGRKFDDVTGGLRFYEFHSGIPYGEQGSARPAPKFIASAKENLKTGVRLFLQGFDDGTQRKTDCTYKIPYDCKSCAKNFALVPQGGFKPDPKDKAKTVFVPKRKVSAIMFDDEKTDFERHRVEKAGLISYDVKTFEKIEALVKKGEQRVPGLDPSKPIADQLDDGKRLEFPCSWVTTVLRYAGSGDQAYWYALEALWTVAGKPSPAPPA